VVELGAGWGSLARLFVERGVPYLGIEPNDVMVASAAREGLPVILGAVSTLADTATVGDDVDCIVSMAVFEHLSEPESALRLMGQTVKPGGRVVVQCPTAGIPRTMGGLAHHLFPDRDLPSFFGSLAPPWHVLLPSPRGMGSMAARCGLDIIEVSTSRSGRARGARQVLQRINEAVALVGSRSFGESWPLTMAHLFVLERPRA
jgi:cyclopropane fatty-acyl-phospholipid synthase-like methyltransferase